MFSDCNIAFAKSSNAKMHFSQNIAFFIEECCRKSTIIKLKRISYWSLAATNFKSFNNTGEWQITEDLLQHNFFWSLLQKFELQ